MKRFLRMIMVAVAVTLGMTAVMAADKGEPAIEFETTAVNMGNVSSSGGPVSATYKFTNTGTAPLVIVKVTNGGCGCTTPSYPKQPIAPGKSGEIVIHFDPSGRRGEFNREVKVKTNASGKRIGLRFKGVIIPK